jgi:hypothetical protein
MPHSIPTASLHTQVNGKVDDTTTRLGLIKTTHHTYVRTHCVCTVFFSDHLYDATRLGFAKATHTVHMYVLTVYVRYSLLTTYTIRYSLAGKSLCMVVHGACLIHNIYGSGQPWTCCSSVVRTGLARTIYYILHTVYIRYYWQGNHKKYRHTSCVYIYSPGQPYMHRFSGPTVHFVDEEFDTGPILAQVRKSNLPSSHNELTQSHSWMCGPHPCSLCV